MKNRLSYRVLSFLFALVFLVTALPIGVFANDAQSVSNKEAEPFIESSDLSSVDEVTLLPTGYEPEPSFVSEVTELRTENVKHFDNGDGTYEAVSYGTAVHRKDANGEWQDIDNTLSIREERGEERYVSSDARISFSCATSNDSAIWSLSENGYSVSLSLSDANLRSSATADVKNHALRAEQLEAAKKAEDRDAVLRVDNRTSIVYRNVLPDVDLAYVLSGNDVKETILVQSACEKYDYSFRLSLFGLIPKATESGAIRLCDAETGESVYVIPVPFMTDAAGEYSEDVVYSFSDLGNGDYSLVVSASDEWINDAERVFPVSIDPTLSTSSNLLDTFVSNASQAAKGTSYGSASILMVDQHKTALFKSTSMPTIPDGSFVLAAKLNVKCYLNYTGTDEIVLSVHRFMQNWDETSTWNDLSNNGQDPTLGINASSTTFQAQSTGGWYYTSISITSAAAHWYSGNRYGTNDNYGIALKPYSGDRVVYFQSHEQNGSNISFSISYSVVNGVYAVRNANTNYYIRSEKDVTSTISVDNLPSFTGTSASEKDHLFKIIYRSTHNDYIFRSMENNELILYLDMSGATPTIKWGKVTVSGAPATNANLPTDYTWRMSASSNGYDLVYHRENYAAPNYYLCSVSSGSDQTLTLTTTANAAGTEWEFPNYTGDSLRGVVSMQSVSSMIPGETIDFDFYAYDDRIDVNGPVSYAIYDTNWNPSTLATVNSTTGVCTAGTNTGTFRLGVTYPNAPWIWGYNITIALLPCSGYEITYSPSLWNNTDALLYSNCYNYALNIRNTVNGGNYLFMQPGNLAGLSCFNLNPQGTYYGYPYFYLQLKTGLDIQSNASADANVLGITFEPIGRYEVCPEGTYKIALVIDLTDDPSIANYHQFDSLGDTAVYIELPDTDYHWYRQNPDGTWSHKPGQTAVINYDASGNTIYDPQICDRDYSLVNYSVFVGYYAVSSLE